MQEWQFREPLTAISWDAPRTVAADKVADLRAALQQDIPGEQLPGVSAGADWSTPQQYSSVIGQDDPYFGGKKMALFARLSLIADEIGETGLAQQARNRVRSVVSPHIPLW